MKGLKIIPLTTCPGDTVADILLCDALEYYGFIEEGLEINRESKTPIDDLIKMATKETPFLTTEEERAVLAQTTFSSEFGVTFGSFGEVEEVTFLLRKYYGTKWYNLKKKQLKKDLETILKEIRK